LFFSAIVPAGWYYGVYDAGTSIQLRIGPANPPTIVVAELQEIVDTGGTGAPVADFEIRRWIEYKVQ
jgi:hypothetical protein